MPHEFHVAESPSEYQERMSHEAALASSLGVAPWSPSFQRAIHEMRQDLMKPRMEVNEEGNVVRKDPYTEDEADEIIREAFRLAKSEANELTGKRSS